MKLIDRNDDHGIVANFFISKGYKISGLKHKKTNGPDLVIHSDNESYRIEVKSVRFSNRAWKVQAVTKNRQDDDLIAIVLPDNQVILEPMDQHLRCCNKGGVRCLTKMVKILCNM